MVNHPRRLFVLASQLPCFLPVISDISPRCLRNPEWIGVTALADQHIAVKIRYHRDIVCIAALPEPGRIASSEFNFNCFQSTFLRIVQLWFP